MLIQTKKFPGLTGNQLKLIALVSMTCDHVGVQLFPKILLLRIIGRLALPIFAYMIAEGCKYTRSRLRYFLTMAALAAVCQAVYWVADGSLYLSVLVTFSLAVPVICALQLCKEAAAAGKGLKSLFAGAVFLAAVALVWYLNRILTIDSGFWGCMLPVLAALFQTRRGASGNPGADRKEVHVLCMGLGLVLLSRSMGGVQSWSLLSLPLLLGYSGKRGKADLKYFFYIFYPVHLAILQGLQWLLA